MALQKKNCGSSSLLKVPGNAGDGVPQAFPKDKQSTVDLNTVIFYSLGFCLCDVRDKLFVGNYVGGARKLL